MDITKNHVKQWLDNERHSRSWLAEQCEVSVKTVNNWLGSERKIPSKAVLIIENLMRVDKQKADAAAVTKQNLVLEFEPDDFDVICRAAVEKRQTPKDWATMTLNKISAEEIERIKSITLTADSTPDGKPIIDFPYIGCVAAGEPVESQLVGETISVESDLNPDAHAVIEINGQSAEPEFMNGDRWLIKRSEDSHTAKKGVPAVFRDENGFYLKVYNGGKTPFTSVNPEFPDVYPGENLKLVGYPVEKITE